jgi:hypothetical protein
MKSIATKFLCLLAVCLLSAACDREDDPDTVDTSLVALFPLDKARVESDDVKFLWDCKEGGDVQFKLYDGATFLEETLTDDEQYVTNRGKKWGHGYQWVLSKGDQEVRQSYAVIHPLEAFVGNHAGVTEHYVSVTGVTTTYADSLSIGLSGDLVSAGLSAGGGGSGGIAQWSTWQTNTVSVQWATTSVNASLSVDLTDGSVGFGMRRQMNSRGDYETYGFSSN